MGSGIPVIIGLAGSTIGSLLPKSQPSPVAAKGHGNRFVAGSE
jgi:hypothetical protein